MRQHIAHLIRGPRVLWEDIYDHALAPFWLWLVGVQVGKNCRLVGGPCVQMSRGAQIVLGNNVALYSRTLSNLRGLAHPTILVAKTPGSCISIGDHTAISGASIVARASISIGRWVQIGAGASIWDNDGHPLNAAQRRLRPTREFRSAPIFIGDDVLIGARAIILKGVNIGAEAVIGAGAVVTKDVAPGDIVAGNPARVVGSVYRLEPTNLSLMELLRIDATTASTDILPSTEEALP